MKQKQNIDWSRALHELEEAKKLQKKKRGVPAWVWGLLPVLLLVPLMGTCGGSKEKPKKNIDGYTLGADGNYHSDRPAWEVAGQHAGIGQKVTFTSDTWGYASQELLTEASRAAGRHAETFAQYNRDTFRQGKACPMYKGEDCKVVDKASNWGDVYLRVRREPGDGRAWWVLAADVE